MDFELTDEQKMVRDTIRKFAETELMPVCAELDNTREFPWDTIKKMAELGFLAPPLPTEYGGGGLDHVAYAIVGEEVARGCASHATILGAHCSLCVMGIHDFGTDEQKQKYLPKLASGEWLGAYSLTEPGAGSDASNLQTIAKKEGEYYIINGQKQWCTNGAEAKVVILFANTNPEAGLRGITPFIIEDGVEGFTKGHIEDTMGIRGSHQTELHFKDVRVHESQILGGEKSIGRGFKIAMIILDNGRIGMAAASVGIAQAALEAAVKYAKEREQFGKKIAEFQAIQWMLADSAAEIEAARRLTYYAAWMKSTGQRVTGEAAMAKMFASEVCGRVCDRALQIHGGYGYSREYPLERLVRDARIKRIYEGTNEIQRLVISRDVLRKY
ncbi:MAG: acyl-CoA dehydrogenase [Planctomycetales bacterium 4484_113]|nr:MAG: acyl-CoA dehydrogenase [Planctomycetales bacterium 4484_113]